MMWPFGKRPRAGAVGGHDRAAYRAAVRAGDDDEADRIARSLLEQDPTDDALWFDLALSAKRRREWTQALDLNERALDVMTTVSRGEPAAWNLGIAATATGDWTRARRAWQMFGLTVPEGDGPLAMNLGAVPVRLNPENNQLASAPLELDGRVHAPEVVWVDRLSPAHGRIVNVPSEDSGHRWGDIVLMDGVPAGERFDGRTWVPVLDELALLYRSPHGTWKVSVHAPEPVDSEDLTTTADDAGCAAEDWTGAIRALCEACSVGRPRHRHADSALEWASERSFGIAAPDETGVAAVLERWTASGAGRSHGALEQVR